MSEMQLHSNHSTGDQIELQAFDLPQNYSILINKLEKLAFGLDTALGNLSLDRKEIEIAVHGSTNDFTENLLEGPIAAGRAPPPHPHGDVEFTRVVSDVWIGVILTLLIVSVIFFICSCFLFHKFQQWKNQYRTNPNDQPMEICRRYGPEFEAESLPSYTIVSGLPTYDDALEEFRKAGIILTPPTPVIKIFDSDSKDNQSIYNMENGLNNDNISGDNISISSTCTCGASAAANPSTLTPNNSYASLSRQSQVIELSPEQLASLSQKRLSLQIAFNNNINQSAVRRNSRPRVDLYREVINRNSILRSRAVGNTAGLDASIFPTIHRSSSTFSLANPNGHRLHQHRGSMY